MNTLFILHFITTSSGLLPSWPLTRQKTFVRGSVYRPWPRTGLVRAAGRTHAGDRGRRHVPALQAPVCVHGSWALTLSRWRARAGCTVVAGIREPAQHGRACWGHLLQPWDKSPEAQQLQTSRSLPDGFRGTGPGPALLRFCVSPWLLSRCHQGGSHPKA